MKKQLDTSTVLYNKGSVTLDHEIRTNSFFHHHNTDPNHNLIHCL